MFINLVDYKVTGSISLNVIHDVSILWNAPEIYPDKLLVDIINWAIIVLLLGFKLTSKSYKSHNNRKINISETIYHGHSANTTSHVKNQIIEVTGFVVNTY